MLFRSVKTINLGGVDAYLTVKDSALDVNIRCEEKYINIMKKGKDGLLLGLKETGLYPDISVTSKEEEVNISTCRDFFDDSELTLLDRMV